jgi:hypothetical protein
MEELWVPGERHTDNLPSFNVTLSESAEKLTSAKRSSAFSANMPISHLILLNCSLFRTGIH